MIEAFITGFGWTMGFIGAWATFMALWVGGAILWTNHETTKDYRERNPDK